MWRKEGDVVGVIWGAGLVTTYICRCTVEIEKQSKSHLMLHQKKIEKKNREEW